MLNIGDINRQPVKRTLKKEGLSVSAVNKIKPLDKVTSNTKILKEQLSNKSGSVDKKHKPAKKGLKNVGTSKDTDIYDKSGHKIDAGQLDITV